MHDPKIIYLQHRKNILIGVGVIFLFILILSVGNITSFVLDNNKLESKINNIQTKINSVSGERDACVSNLDSSNKELKNCIYNITTVRNQISTCSLEKEIITTEKTKVINQLSKCEQEKSDIGIKYNNQLDNFDTFVRNYAKTVCCSIGDVKTGSVRNWSVVSNDITCSGSFSVNCTTGQTTP